MSYVKKHSQVGSKTGNRFVGNSNFDPDDEYVKKSQVTQPQNDQYESKEDYGNAERVPYAPKKAKFQKKGGDQGYGEYVKKEKFDKQQKESDYYEDAADEYVAKNQTHDQYEPVEHPVKEKAFSKKKKNDRLKVKGQYSNYTLKNQQGEQDFSEFEPENNKFKGKQQGGKFYLIDDSNFTSQNDGYAKKGKSKPQNKSNYGFSGDQYVPKQNRHQDNYKDSNAYHRSEDYGYQNEEPYYEQETGYRGQGEEDSEYWRNDKFTQETKIIISVKQKSQQESIISRIKKNKYHQEEDYETEYAQDGFQGNYREGKNRNYDKYEEQGDYQEYDDFTQDQASQKPYQQYKSKSDSRYQRYQGAEESNYQSKKSYASKNDAYSKTNQDNSEYGTEKPTYKTSKKEYKEKSSKTKYSKETGYANDEQNYGNTDGAGRQYNEYSRNEKKSYKEGKNWNKDGYGEKTKVHEEGDARKGKYSSKYRDLEGEENGQQTESTWKKDKYAKDKEYRTEKEPYKQKEYNKESEKNVTGEYEVEEENQNEVADLDLRSALLREMKKYKIDDRPHSFTSIPKDRSYTVLMVAEKPSIAKSIAEALAPGKNFKSVKGRSPVCLIHQFEYNIFGRKCFVKITSVAGHIYGRDFPGKYASWDRTDPAELFDAPTIKQYSEPKQRMSEHLKNEGRNADFLVLWLDNDREGENICFEVTSLVQPVMRSNRFKQIYRAVFSSLAPEDLRNAYKSLSKGPNMEESLSVDARQILDLKIGVAFSRFQSVYFGEKYSNLRNNLITYGPCQTPTLGFCVERKFEIDNFVPQKYYNVKLELSTGKNKISCTYKVSKRMNKPQAEELKKKLTSIGVATVVDVQSKEKKRARPTGLNTVEMLKHASSRLGMGPQHALSVAERLYLQGFLTYPRTESTAYPDKFDHNSVVSAISVGYSQGVSLRDYSKQLLENGINKPKKGVDVGDHPPITPTTAVPSALFGDEARVYDFVTRRYLASIGYDATYIKTKVTFQFDSVYSVQVEGMILQEKGYLEAADWEGFEHSELGEYRIGERFSISGSNIVECETEPPGFISESELLGLMEKFGIGTDASMASHINNICEREYVTVSAGRKLVPTDLGIALVSGYKAVDESLVSPDLRSGIEKSCADIASGRSKFDQVVLNVSETFKQKFMDFKKNVSKMDAFFKNVFTSFEAAKDQSKTWTICGDCNRYMDLVKDYNKIICETCKKTYTLPKSNNYIKSNNDRCPVDNFQIFQFVQTDIKGNNIGFDVCPCCYNKGIDIEDVADQDDKQAEDGQQETTAAKSAAQTKKEDNQEEDSEDAADDCARMECRECQNSKCAYSAPKHKVMTCELCKQGDMLIHQSTKKEWFLICNNPDCHLSFKIGNQGHKICLNKACETCGRKTVKVGYTKNHPTRAGEEEVLCMWCNIEYQQQNITKIGVNVFPEMNARGRKRFTGRNNLRGKAKGRGGKQAGPI